MTEVINGSAGNDLFHGGDDTLLIGGLGNDVYYLWSATSRAVEQDGEGFDTIYAGFWGAAIMPEGFEALWLTTMGSIAGIGNSTANQIHGGPVMATLNGKGGDDILHGGTGPDLFVVEVGNGSDTLVGFTSGFDTIRLQGYGFTSFAAVRGAATQAGTDVAIALGNGERLTLAGIDLAGLQAADFGYSNVGAPVPDGLARISGEGTVAANGLYVHNNVWGAHGLTPGVDFFIDSTYKPGDFSAATTFNWDFPATTDPYGPVRGYPELFFGAAPFGDTVNAADTTRTFPVQLSSISALTTTFDTSMTGSTGSFNIAYDIWLTSAPNGGPGEITNEIMIWTHAHEHQPWGDKVGSFEVSGIAAEVWHFDTYTAVILADDMMAGTIDLVDLFAKLEQLGIVSQNEWLASVHFGAEIIGGVGSLTISQFDIRMTAEGADGTLTTTLVDGTGAQVLDVQAPTPDGGIPGLTAVHDEYGLLTGYISEHQDAVGDPLIRQYDTTGTLTGWDIIVTVADGHVFTKHFDARGVQVGYDAVYRQGDALGLAAYDSSGALLSFAREYQRGTASTETLLYDAAWQLTGRELKAVSGNTTTISHYAADGSLTGSTVTIAGADGAVTRVEQRGADGMIDRYTVTQVDADGVLAAFQHDGDDRFLGAHHRWVRDDGVTVQADYDAGWSLTGHTYVGTAAADTLYLAEGRTLVLAGGGADHIVASRGADTIHIGLGGAPVTIDGFTAGEDRLVLELQGSHSTIAANMATLTYHAASGQVLFDADGAGAGAAVAVAQLAANLGLGGGDLLIA
ncbi:GH12 family glycosyl hydrolase domain-containing protein [Croceibacterium mercuriale]|uniref:GH12 family glycosyl hydrolase domain-containing protein n=1 Tax=Croceibacterium mercuriale TaxID=1572751 RepID=UPI0006892379|nr:hypothetical protein [Croceibacterium mercuriale]